MYLFPLIQKFGGGPGPPFMSPLAVSFHFHSIVKGCNVYKDPCQWLSTAPLLKEPFFFFQTARFTSAFWRRRFLWDFRRSIWTRWPTWQQLKQQWQHSHGLSGRWWGSGSSGRTTNNNWPKVKRTKNKIYSLWYEIDTHFSKGTSCLKQRFRPFLSTFTGIVLHVASLMWAENYPPSNQRLLFTLMMVMLTLRAKWITHVHEKMCRENGVRSCIHFYWR